MRWTGREGSGGFLGGGDGGEDGSDEEDDAERNKCNEPCFHYVKVLCYATLQFEIKIYLL